MFKTTPNAKIELPKISGADQQMQSQINALMQSQLGNLMSAESMNKILNLTAWSIFMAILILACGKISSIGVQLIKTEKQNV
ncbi:MAG: hypothetical protein V1819_01035 [bacterium]